MCVLIINHHSMPPFRGICFMQCIPLAGARTGRHSTGNGAEGGEHQTAGACVSCCVPPSLALRRGVMCRFLIQDVISDGANSASRQDLRLMAGVHCQSGQQLLPQHLESQPPWVCQRGMHTHHGPRPLLSDTGGGVILALPGFWLTHPPTLRPTHPPAGYPEGGGGSQSNFRLTTP